MDEKLREKIADDLDMMLALQEENIDGPRARATALRLIGEGDFAEYPAKRGEQIEFLDRLAIAVLAELGQAQPETKKTGPRVEKEGWDENTQGATIIKTPIG